MMNLKPMVAGFALVALAGCSIANVNNSMKRAEDTSATAEGYAATMRERQSAPSRPTVMYEDAPWVSTRPIELKMRGVPEALNCDISYAPIGDVDVFQIGQEVTKLCGIPVRVTPDVMGGTGNSGGGSQAPLQAALSQNPSLGGASLPPLPSIPGLPNMPSPGGYGSTGNGSTRNLTLNNFKWKGGPVKGLLDMATARLGLSWKYSDADRVITIFYLDTKSFKFYAIPSAIDMSTMVQSGTTSSAGVGGSTGSGAGNGTSSGVSGSSGSNSVTGVTTKTNITEDLGNSVQSMLTPGVGRMSMSTSMGTFVVTDTPEVLARVGSFLASANENITKQVLLNVKVLRVSLTDKDDVDVDWNLVYKAVNGKFGLGWKNVTQADSAAVNGSVNILDSSSQWNGSSLLVKALAQQGRVSTITSPSVTTLNMRPVPVQVARQTSYLASIQTTNTAQVGSTTSLTPGTVTSGFNMSLLPNIMPNNELTLDFSIDMSALRQLRKTTSGDSSIESPDIDKQIFAQSVKLKSGQTLILSGFVQSIDNGNKSGVGSPSNWLMGGGLHADNSKDVIVILITPVLEG
ncbi:PilN family type IVB pilus formation outer membrane protein [Pseudomonas sp. WS 5532]|uniref:PilN family type IVB pilus formation outer membrane protein n=1 Tax=Pseudomonas sp. WS 5532 TaxID=2717495 RepID=UPI0014727B8D|nr:PilN family type IVB pilus formation outer membrane protein [Pseudomonas sp. WS 5532]